MEYFLKRITKRLSEIIDSLYSQALRDQLNTLIKDSELDEILLYQVAIILNSNQLPFEAISVLKLSLLINAGNPESYKNLGHLFCKLGFVGQSINSYRLALKAVPLDIICLYELANIYLSQNDYIKAQDIYYKILSIEPNHADTFLNLGLLLQKQGLFKDSIDFFVRSLSIKDPFPISPSDKDLAREGLIFSSLSICDWQRYSDFISYLNDLGLRDSPVVPLALMALEDDPHKHLVRAKKFYEKHYARPKNKSPFIKKQKIRLAYLSANYYEHAVMNLMVRMFELHDRTKFEIYVYSYNVKHNDHITSRVKNSVDKFIDINHLNDKESVELIRKDSIDIAIDLMGYTQDTRLGIFASGIAPIQVTYLGYPGTIGSDCFDYIIADKIIIPSGSECFYSERVIYMPSSYQCNDDHKCLTPKDTLRSDYSLPDIGFVFACFNANFKITPPVFDIWMRLLHKVNGSVLWLLSSNTLSETNLLNEANSRGIPASRIIFARKLPIADHLKRHSCADLFLDTFNYNAHTTASDALSTGLPLVTMAGSSFSARVAASLLMALDLPELIASSPSQYENIAYKLATNPYVLGDLKNRLESSLKSSNLFNPYKFTRDLETKYLEMLPI